MEHYHSLEQVTLRDAWLTIGAFDGVHLGHQNLIRLLREGARANDAPTVVLTFYPHPAVVLRGIQKNFYLSTPEEKSALMEQLGVDVLITHPFDKRVAKMRAREFIQWLRQHVNFRHLRVGYNFALGRNREGDIPALEKLGAELSYSLSVTPPVEMAGEIISSSGVRSLLAEGKVEKVARWLGRPYGLTGKVVSGDVRGRSLGFPTANLETWAEQAQPGSGVYVCWVEIDGKWFGAVVNVGVRPTFEFQPVSPRVEAHLLDFEGDLYGTSLTLRFISRIREERRFPDARALVAQIEQDILQARERLDNIAGRTT